MKLYTKLYTKLYAKLRTGLCVRLYLKLTPFYKANLYLLVVLSYYLRLAY